MITRHVSKGTKEPMNGSSLMEKVSKKRRFHENMLVTFSLEVVGFLIDFTKFYFSGKNKVNVE